MTRQELDDMLVDYLYDELEPVQRAAFEAGLDEHPELAAEVEAHRKTRSQMAELPTFALPAGLLDGVLAEAQQAAEAHAEATAAEKRPGFFERLSRLLLQPAFATAALAVVVIGVGVIYLGRPDPMSDPNRQRLEPVVAVHPEAAEATGAADEPRDDGKGQAEVKALEEKPAAAKDQAPAPEGAFEQGDGAVDAEASTPPAIGMADDSVALGGAKATGDDAAFREPASKPAPARDVKTVDKKRAPARHRAAAKAEVMADEPGTGAAVMELDVASDALRKGGETSKPAEASPAKTSSSGTGSSRGGAAARPASAPAAETKKDTAGAVRTSHGALPEVPIPVPSEEDAEKAVRTSDRANAPAPAPPAAPEPAPPGEAAEGGADAAPAREVLEEESAVERVSVQRSSAGSSTSREEERQRAEERRKAAEAARVAELWKRYDRYVASERWSDAEEVLDALDDIPSEVARVRALRPQLAKRKAAAEAERASRKHETVKQPTTDSTYK